MISNAKQPEQLRFCGDERDHRTLLRCLAAGEDWTQQQRVSAVTLTPAACYPV